MDRRFALTVGVFFAVLGPSSAIAQTPPTASGPIDAPSATRAFTIAEALAYAHLHQPAIRAALSRVATRLAEAQVATAEWEPKLAATAQLFAMTANNTTATYVGTRTMDVARIGGTPATATGNFSPYASTFVGAGVLQEVFDFGRISARRAAADALVNVERRTADEARLVIDFGVEEAFFSVLAGKGVVRAADEAYARSLVHRDLAKRGVDAGMRSPIELTRADADLAEYDIGRVRARGGLAIAQSVLAASMGAPDPAVDAADEEPSPPDMPTMAEALNLAEQRDPRLASAVAQLRAAEERARAIGAELRPDLSLTATLSGRAGGAPSSSGQNPAGDGWVPRVPNWDAGLVFTWPLFDGVVLARKKAAASEQQVRLDEIDRTREEDMAQARQTYVEVQVARSALVALATAAVAARANWEQADARFRAGIGNAVELADAEALRTHADIQRALGQFDLARARAAFGRAIAEGL